MLLCGLSPATLCGFHPLTRKLRFRSVGQIHNAGAVDAGVRTVAAQLCSAGVRDRGI